MLPSCLLCSFYWILVQSGTDTDTVYSDTVHPKVPCKLAPHIACLRLLMTVWRLVGLIFLAQLSDLMWIEPTNNSTTVGMTPTTPAYRNTPLQPFSTSSNETVNEYPCGVNLDFRGDVGTVTGGEETEKHEYPWMVYVCGEYNYEYEEVSISDIAYDNTIIKCNEACGGTLISTKHVLTAAHCVAKSSRSIDNTYVLLGAHNIQESREYAYLSAIHIFPGYKKDVERSSDCRTHINFSPKF